MPLAKIQKTQPHRDHICSPHGLAAGHNTLRQILKRRLFSHLPRCKRNTLAIKPEFSTGEGVFNNENSRLSAVLFLLYARTMNAQQPALPPPKTLIGCLRDLRFWGGLAVTIIAVIGTYPIWGMFLMGISLALGDDYPNSLWGSATGYEIMLSIPAGAGVIAGALIGIALCQDRSRLLFVGVALPVVAFIIEITVLFMV